MDDQLSLFDATAAYRFPEELLTYEPDFLPVEEAAVLLTELIETAGWQQTSIRIQDKVLQTPRLIAWYGDPGH